MIFSFFQTKCNVAVVSVQRFDDFLHSVQANTELAKRTSNFKNVTKRVVKYPQVSEACLIQFLSTDFAIFCN